MNNDGCGRGPACELETELVHGGHTYRRRGGHPRLPEIDVGEGEKERDSPQRTCEWPDMNEED
jgi:hypothetical protein